MFFKRSKKTVRRSQTSTIDRQSLRLFWRTGVPYRRLLAMGMLFPAGVLLSGVVAPLCIGKTLGALALPHGQPRPYFYLLLIAGAGGLVCNRIGHPALLKYQALTQRDMQELALTTLLSRSVGFHTSNVGGKLVSDAIDFPLAYAKLYDAIATSLLPLSVTLVIGSAIIFTQSWMLGLYITLITAIIMGLGVRDSRRMAPRRAARQKASKATTAHIADTVTNIQTAKMFSREDYELKEHRRLSAVLTDIRIKDWRRMSVNGNTRLIVLAALQALLIFAIVRLVQHDRTLLGIGIFAFSFTVTLGNRLFEVNILFRNIEEALLEASPMTQIIEETPEIRDPSGARSINMRGGEIAFTGVHFAYPDSANNRGIFSDLNLVVKQGEKVGLVGPSGGGKSTLTRLLLRFDDIQAGEITIDGQSVAAVTQASLRRSIAYVPQEPLLFHRTIRKNIAYGQPTAVLAAVKRAAKLAHADEFISKMQGGYDTIVGERGVKLSGGQRQRVAIARAILKDAPILVLDEATSALDSESEVLIQDALWQLMNGRTALVIAHRLSTIQRMDRIVVLDDGKIVEQGTHKQLLRAKGLYAKLWTHQSGGFIEE